MKSYRLVVRQNGRMVGHFDTSGKEALEDICVARAMFGIAGGTTVSCWWRIRNDGCWKAGRRA